MDSPGGSDAQPTRSFTQRSLRFGDSQTTIHLGPLGKSCPLQTFLLKWTRCNASLAGRRVCHHAPDSQPKRGSHTRILRKHNNALAKRGKKGTASFPSNRCIRLSGSSSSDGGGSRRDQSDSRGPRSPPCPRVDSSLSPCSIHAAVLSLLISMRRPWLSDSPLQCRELGEPRHDLGCDPEPSSPTSSTLGLGHTGQRVDSPRGAGGTRIPTGRGLRRAGDTYIGQVLAG